MSEAILAVYDCVVFVQAALRPARVHGTMRLVEDGAVTLCVSPAIIAELEDVLTRPAMRSRFSALTPQRVSQFLEYILSHAKVVWEVPIVFPLARDPKDEPYINLAVAQRPCCLVTWNNRHLTYLMRQDTPEGRDFCSRYPNVTITDPPGFVRYVNQLRKAAGE